LWGYICCQKLKMVLYQLTLLSSIALGVIAQLFLKQGVEKAGIENISKTKIIDLIKKFFNWSVVLGFFSYGLSLLFWMVTLSSLDLSYAYPMVSFSYVLVAFSSKFFFKEKVSARRWISIIVITLGVILIGLS